MPALAFNEIIYDVPYIERPTLGAVHMQRPGIRVAFDFKLDSKRKKRGKPLGLPILRFAVYVS
jgi:hypothetical protein